MRDDEAARSITVEFGSAVDDDTVERVRRAVVAALAEPLPKGARIDVRRA
jgi:hypothetical protein